MNILESFNANQEALAAAMQAEADAALAAQAARAASKVARDTAERAEVRLAIARLRVSACLFEIRGDATMADAERRDAADKESFLACVEKGK